jgi:hypothetical protein
MFSLTFSTICFAEWKRFGYNYSGDTYYLDFDSIKRNVVYVYYWTLEDYQTPVEGFLSAKFYNKGDCNMGRFISLKSIYYSQSMGDGTAQTYRDRNWIDAAPGSVFDKIMKVVCE